MLPTVYTFSFSEWQAAPARWQVFSGKVAGKVCADGRIGAVFTLGVIIAFAVVLAMAIPAMAYDVDETSKSVPGYGTLYGSQNSVGGYSTTVTQNPDNAVLSITTTVQNIAGTTILNASSQSEAGATVYSGTWSSLPDDAYALWGAHGVQSGWAYSAQAVYTVTHVTT